MAGIEEGVEAGARVGIIGRWGFSDGGLADNVGVGVAGQ